MQLKGCFLISVLGLTSSLVMADEVNCTTLANPQARQECLQHKYDNTPDCAKLATPEARRQCAKQKAK